MSEGEHPSDGLRVLFFGLPAGVSAVVLAGLLDDGIELAGVVVPATAVPHLILDSAPPVMRVMPHLPAGVPLASDTGPADMLGVAWAAGVPVLAVRDFDHPTTVDALAEFRADVACVACFTQRIPAVILNLPRIGFLNLHPSLLPAYRGPSPVFWMLREGETAAGATVHYMDDGLDTGDIAAQEAVPLPDAIAEPDAERLLMYVGLELLRGVLSDLAEGIVRRRPQPPGGSYYGFPREEDFALSTEWPARRAFNFMRGTAGRGLPYAVEIAGKTEGLAVADDYRVDVGLDRPSVRHGRNIIIRFNPGVLYAHTVR